MSARAAVPKALSALPPLPMMMPRCEAASTMMCTSTSTFSPSPRSLKSTTRTWPPGADRVSGVLLGHAKQRACFRVLPEVGSALRPTSTQGWCTSSKSGT